MAAGNELMQRRLGRELWFSGSPAAGYALAARGVDTRMLQAFMGHRSIANTVIYTAVADKRVRNI